MPDKERCNFGIGDKVFIEYRGGFSYSQTAVKEYLIDIVTKSTKTQFVTETGKRFMQDGYEYGRSKTSGSRYLYATLYNAEKHDVLIQQNEQLRIRKQLLATISEVKFDQFSNEELAHVLKTITDMECH